ncbi:MAG: hypothetical protein ACYCUJ_08440 [Acidithiobacillus sp.]
MPVPTTWLKQPPELVVTPSKKLRHKMLLNVMPQERVTTYAWDTKYDLQNGTDGINPGLIRLAHGCQFLLGFIHLRLKGIQTFQLPL